MYIYTEMARGTLSTHIVAFSLLSKAISTYKTISSLVACCFLSFLQRRYDEIYIS